MTLCYCSCASKLRCGTCLEEEHCVWCGPPGGAGTCVPGREQQPRSQQGCPYDGGGVLNTVCACQVNRCTAECKQRSCGECADDLLCGWCGSSQTCMQGGVSGPKFDLCTDQWIAHGSCESDWGVWVIGLVCAGVSSTLVAVMCCYICVRLHRNRGAAEQPRTAPSAEDTQQVVASLHAFTYKHCEETPGWDFLFFIYV
jgi:hypothetical protein